MHGIHHFFPAGKSFLAVEIRNVRVATCGYVIHTGALGNNQTHATGGATERFAGGGGDVAGGQQAAGDGQYKGAQGLDPEFIKELEKQFGFDKPPIERFFTMLWNYIRFDFGESYFRKISVTDLVLEKMPVSITLGLWSTLIAYLVSIPLGIRKAVRDGSPFDTWTSGAIIVAYAIPGFLFAIMLLVLFAGGSYWKLFPLRGLTSDNFEDLTMIGKVLDYLWHITLPVLASTIANPLSDLAAAAEIGREKNARKFSPSRVRIPDLTARPDEIGRLSGALRGMVTALYDRIDANEQFAAEVAHEIKNPLASLSSAVTSLRTVTREDHRAKLLDVIEHDTVRLDRLVSDISNASRLDSELVKEDEEPFDLLKMIGNLASYLGEDASEKGVEFITDMPSEPIVIEGLESRLAQVFVNLLTNALSFCDDGDAIRVWVRKRENRVLVVVEDTGPGIPEQALTKIFNRFYTDRPVRPFGNNSGLGLAICKRFAEAMGGDVVVTSEEGKGSVFTVSLSPAIAFSPWVNRTSPVITTTPLSSV